MRKKASKGISSKKKRKPSQSTRRKNLLKKDKLTKREYKELKGIQLKEFREESFRLKDPNFQVQVYRKIKVKGGGKRVVQINANEFRAGGYYEVYVKHKPTGQRRLLAIGKLQDIPIRTKQIEKFGAFLGGRTFNPSLKYPKRAIGKWVPVTRIVRDIQKELEEYGKEIRTEVRASIIPMKRYYHTKWKIYSDKILKGSKLIKKCFVHCAVRFVYPNTDWIGKQSIFLEFNRRTRIDKVYQLREKLEDRINQDLELLHPNANEVSLIEVNGFIPL